MALTESLRQDHAVLRNKVVMLESALSAAPSARLVFREKCFSLLRTLNRHMIREGPLIRFYYDRIPSARYLSHPKDHSAEHGVLRTVTELLLGGLKVSMSHSVLRVSQALEQLNEQMDEQERSVFPLFEHLTEEDLVPYGRVRQPSPSITGSMSVNALLQRYPRAEVVLAPLCINRLREGYESVEELAWRRGMDASQLLEQLRQAITSITQS